MRSFGAMLFLDEQGEFASPNPGCPNHRLRDKLLWGSDYPMLLDEYGDYQTQFDCFLHAVRKNRIAIPNDQELLENMVCTNPKAFLRIP